MTDSRPQHEGLYTRRLRKCEGCGHRFTTHESVVNDDGVEVARAKAYASLMAGAKALQEEARTIMNGNVARGILKTASANQADDDAVS